MNTARVSCGAISLSNSSHFPPRLGSIFENPVVLPPGRARLCNKTERDGLADCHEYDRDRAIGRVHGSHCWWRIGNYDVCSQAEQVRSGGPCQLIVGDSETIVDLQISTHYPSEFAETLL